jgi:membrane protein
MKLFRGMRLPGKGMGWKDFFKSLKNEYTTDRVGDVAGNLTFKGVLAIFPFLIFLVALASLLLTPESTQSIIQGMGKVAPAEVTKIFSEQIKSLQEEGGAGLLTVSAVGAIWAASNGVIALMAALNTAYDVKEGRPWWKVRLIAIGATLFAAVMSLVAGLAAVATPAVAHFLGEPLGTIMLWLRLPAAGIVMMAVWAVLYYFLPDTEQKFAFITPGSVAGVLIWVLASYGFSVYVANFGKYEATYGALGGVVVLLLWMWISAQVLLIGAEINALIEHRSPDGKRPGAKSSADTGAAPSKSEQAEQAVGGGFASPAMQRRARGSGGGMAPGQPARPQLSSFHKLKDRIWAGFAAIAFLRSRRRATH